MGLHKKWKYLVLIMIPIIFLKITSTADAAEVKGGTFTRDKYVYTITKIASQNEMGRVSVSVRKEKQDTIKTAEIPQTVIYNSLVYQVKSIGQSAFYDCTNLTSVTVPNTVTIIGKLAFGKCDSLISINIPDSVSTIGNNAFYGCTSKLVISCPINSKAFIYVKNKNLNFKALVNENSTSNKKLIIVGDSRTHNMSKWVNTSVPTKFVAKSGQGYNWFVSEGINSVNAIKNPGDTIVIWLGVNDYFSTTLGGNSWTVYANKINDLTKYEWSDCKVYVAAVGYVDRGKMLLYYGTCARSNVTMLNENNNLKGIQEFNELLKSSLSNKISWINTYNVIGIHNNDSEITSDDLWITRENGKKDGLHYGVAKTQEVYNYFVECTFLK